ncbi:50S ribosomal protein L25/general stress protein Ctc [Nocardia blacklockiae]|uniref:50S ribosomal protein L25/general stress protein Ctc n=1 Tax=Nocardia blacklockiae TaxID=480036 RepID=UPI00189359DB|nr:50S ribosomal protein L25/general stress protein Ctc [Nocardia blacklockiae]MBF6171253.1 50S ribosomal protein L25/general stress protein Ctc [Nocardia blacklockiae]
MSDASLLEATVRTEFGKGAARRTRRAGHVPAVLYGHGEAPKHLSVDAHAFAAILREHGTNAVLNLEIEGKKQLALTKSVVVHPIRRYIEHADLLIVKRGEKVVADVHVVLSGDAAAGTLVTQDATTISVEADALNIPEEIEVSIEGAEAGTQITAGQITLPKGVTLDADPETLLVNVITAPAAEAAEPAETEGESEDESAE